MAKVNDLQCAGDALIQGDAKVNGKLNNEILDVDSNCLIIDVCRRLDLSAVDNEINIPIPDGYLADPRSLLSSTGCFAWTTKGTDTSAWTTDAVITISTVVNSNVVTFTEYISNDSFAGTASIPAPCEQYINFKVTTACTGATNPYVMITCRIYCHKE